MHILKMECLSLFYIANILIDITTNNILQKYIQENISTRLNLGASKISLVERLSFLGLTKLQF